MDRLELEYAGSAEHPEEWPRWHLPEIAVAGRSNSGKSSLLNSLGGRRDLARVSKTPGRTQRLHFFAEKRFGFALVDLPGYGFARAPGEARARFARAVEAYFTRREQLRGLLMLLDVRRDPEDDERLLVEFGRRRGVTILPVATKVDKLARSERERRLAALDAAGLGPWIGFSAPDRIGREALLRALVAIPRDTGAE